ncbi:cytochrome P450 [Actinomadura sp. LOL_016]|uniref:cytochrome P450 n=1 Tax=unclassified Actinomadura TaxID=2626254 RepID=UPI003A80A7C7
MTALADIDLSKGRFWAAPPAERAAAFATLRRERPVAFFAEPRAPWAARRGPGFYAVTRHADVVEASRRPRDFSSAEGVNLFDRPPESLEFFDSMINMDDPRHARLRRIVSRAFTPSMIGRLDAEIRRVAARVVDDLLERGACDFVAEVAERLLYYWSANRDESVFGAPERFDVTRSPNPHLGFGAPGPHYCLGAHLARGEVTAVFRELLARAPGVRAAGEPDRLRSNFLNGIKRLPCALS